jgi:hypothetical protein
MADKFAYVKIGKEYALVELNGLKLQVRLEEYVDDNSTYSIGKTWIVVETKYISVPEEYLFRGCFPL